MSASAARTEAPSEPRRVAPPGRGAIVHLTPYAPGCAHMAVDHPKRWRHLWHGDAARVLRAVLTRCRQDPNAVQLVIGPANDDVDVLATLQTEPAPVPVAVITDGPSLNDLAGALANLRRTGWTPSTLNPGA